MESLPITKGPDALDSLLSTAKKLADGGAIQDEIVSGIYGVSAGICGDAVTYRDKKKLNNTYKLDNIVTSKIWGFPSCSPFSVSYSGLRLPGLTTLLAGSLPSLASSKGI